MLCSGKAILVSETRPVLWEVTPVLMAGSAQKLLLMPQGHLLKCSVGQAARESRTLHSPLRHIGISFFLKVWDLGFLVSNRKDCLKGQCLRSQLWLEVDRLEATRETGNCAEGSCGEGEVLPAGANSQHQDYIHPHLPKTAANGSSEGPL